ncbi:MAG: adenylosuccinate lyase [Acidobacteria bacterium]|nr:adenylosuccinate lyase [Acidobacteriota bacterium]
MIARYSLPEMAAVFTDEARFARYLEIELCATEAQAEIGAVPAAAAAACRARAPRVDAAFVAAVAERERTTDHDVAAFVDVAQAAIGMPDGAWLHHGLTSSDVVDTAWCSMLRDAAELILDAADGLVDGLVALARRHADTPMMGRTHGMHAELTTFGAKVALWALQVDRDRVRLRAARESVAVCKLSGAVGTYSNVDPRVEQVVAARLGLRAVPATQVVARDRHAEYLWACASLGTTIGAIATELRHLQRSEVGEVREGFKPGQKGSSAMPHKRNPISAETLTGLSRLLRANAQAGMENVALWHERDISHSSVERVVLPDSSLLAHYATVRMTRLVASLEVDGARMAATIASSRGLAHSQAVLLALVAAGLPRDEAYRTVQDASSRATAEGRHLRDVLQSSAGMPLGAAELEACFDQAAALRHARRAVDALDGLA